jgi:hypothetical protein
MNFMRSIRKVLAPIVGGIVATVGLVGCGDGDLGISGMVPPTEAPTGAVTSTATPVDGETPTPVEDETPTPTSTATPLDCLPSGEDCLLPSDCCSGECSFDDVDSFCQ